MRGIHIVGWTAALGSLLFMLLGHMGDHSLQWQINQISSYAARAPYDYWVTTSMLLASVLLLNMGWLVSRDRQLSARSLAYAIPPLSGAAAAGLLMLAYYEETAINITALKQSGFWSIRIQSFHDAGLDIFFYSALLLIFLLGGLLAVYRKTGVERLIGFLILLLSPIAYVLMTTSWPKILGMESVGPGLNQRAGLFCLWFAATLFLFALSRTKRDDVMSERQVA